MTLDEIIQGRRSVRKYTSDIPSEESIEKMIHAAALSPNPSNSQPVRFFRISSPEIRTAFYDAMVEGREKFFRKITEKGLSKRKRNVINYYWRFSEFMFDAPVLLAMGTVTTLESFSQRLFNAGLTEHIRRRTIDNDITVGLALNSLMLKARELGLGTCVLTAPMQFVPDPETVLGVTDIRIKCFVTVGYPESIPLPVERKRIEEIYKEI